MFLAPEVVRATNAWVHNQPEDRLPTFRYTAPNLVVMSGGSILRYSTTGEPR
jgi:hypothetical protein